MADRYSVDMSGVVPFHLHMQHDLLLRSCVNILSHPHGRQYQVRMDMHWALGVIA